MVLVETGIVSRGTTPDGEDGVIEGGISRQEGVVYAVHVRWTGEVGVSARGGVSEEKIETRIGAIETG